MKQINLLPEAEVKELKLELASGLWLRFYTILGSTLVILLILGFVTRILISATIASNEAQIQQLRRQLTSSNNQALEKQVVDLNTQMRNLETLNRQHYYWSDALIELGNLSPADFHLDTVTLDRATGEVVVMGTADNRSSVLEFWSAVHKSKYFTRINFPLNNLQQAANTPFTFTFFINSEPLKSKQ